MSDRIVEVGAHLRDGAIATDLGLDEIADRVMERGQIVILKGAFPEDLLAAVRSAVWDWAQGVEPAAADDFRGAYHRRRAMVSRLQQSPHVFHDYNFNGLAGIAPELETRLRALFEPLNGLYAGLTGIDAGFQVPAHGPYVHPQLIQYPSGGGFFARHWHNLLPQKIGFIVSLSKHGRDYRNGGAVFEIEGEVVDMERRHDLGDICVWRYDHHHWVTQSDLQDKFDWNSDGGRWVATFAYFDPAA